MEINGTRTFYLVARLAEEAGVCLTGNEIGNRVEIHKATYDVVNGLLVTDRAGKTFRLKVTAEERDTEHKEG